jgi:hypothetical protein
VQLLMLVRPMSDRKVVPFRPRPPSAAELEIYKLMTRTWHPEMRRRIFPEHFRRVEQELDAEARPVTT